MEASPDTTNLLVKSFQSDHYLIQPLETDPEFRFVCNYSSNSLAKTEYSAKAIFADPWLFSQLPMSVLSRMNDLHASSGEPLFFEEYFATTYSHGGINDLRKYFKIVDYEKKYKENDLNPYLRLDNVPTLWRGIATYEVKLENGKIRFKGHAEKRIKQLFDSFRTEDIRVFKLDDFYVLYFNDPNDSSNYNTNGTYFIYPEKYAHIHAKTPSRILSGISVKSHRYLPVRVDQIKAIGPRGKTMVYHPERTIRKTSEKRNFDGLSLEEKSTRYWDETVFENQYLTFVPDRLSVSWYSYIEDRYYSDEIPLSQIGPRPRKVNEKLPFSYLPHMDLNIFPDAKLTLSTDNNVYSFLKMKEIKKDPTNKQTLFKSSDEAQKKSAPPGMVQALDKQFQFHSWVIKSDLDNLEEVKVILHDGGSLIAPVDRVLRSPLPQTLSFATLNAEYDLYLDVFQLQSALEQNGVEDKTPFKIFLDMNLKKPDSISLVIEVHTQRIPFSSFQLVRKKRNRVQQS